MPILELYPFRFRDPLSDPSDSSFPSRDRSAAVKPFTTLAIAFLTLIAIVHLLRLFAGWEVIVTGFVIPVWWSAFGLLIAGGLALMAWREAHR
jgi:hypothetical protein